MIYKEIYIIKRQIYKNLGTLRYKFIFKERTTNNQSFFNI